MNKDLYTIIKQSDKTIDDVALVLGCTVEELKKKINGVLEFTANEILILTTFIPIQKPLHIFFDNSVAKMDTMNL